MKGSGPWLGWEAAIEVIQLFLSILTAFDRDPKIVDIWVSLPFDKVLHLATTYTCIKNPFNFVFLMFINDVRGGGGSVLCESKAGTW